MHRRFRLAALAALAVLAASLAAPVGADAQPVDRLGAADTTVHGLAYLGLDEPLVGAVVVARDADGRRLGEVTRTNAHGAYALGDTRLRSRAVTLTVRGGTTSRGRFRGVLRRVAVRSGVSADVNPVTTVSAALARSRHLTPAAAERRVRRALRIPAGLHMRFLLHGAAYIEVHRLLRHAARLGGFRAWVRHAARRAGQGRVMHDYRRPLRTVGAPERRPLARAAGVVTSIGLAIAEQAAQACDDNPIGYAVDSIGLGNPDCDVRSQLSTLLTDVQNMIAQLGQIQTQVDKIGADLAKDAAWGAYLTAAGTLATTKNQVVAAFGEYEDFLSTLSLQNASGAQTLLNYIQPFTSQAAVSQIGAGLAPTTSGGGIPYGPWPASQPGPDDTYVMVAAWNAATSESYFVTPAASARYEQLRQEWIELLSHMVLLRAEYFHANPDAISGPDTQIAQDAAVTGSIPDVDMVPDGLVYDMARGYQEIDENATDAGDGTFIDVPGLLWGAACASGEPSSCPTSSYSVPCAGTAGFNTTMLLLPTQFQWQTLLANMSQQDNGGAPLSYLQEQAADVFNTSGTAGFLALQDGSCHGRSYAANTPGTDHFAPSQGQGPTILGINLMDPKGGYAPLALPGCTFQVGVGDLACKVPGNALSAVVRAPLCSEQFVPSFAAQAAAVPCPAPPNPGPQPCEFQPGGCYYDVDARTASRRG